VLVFHDGGKQCYWAVRTGDGRVVVTLLNDSSDPATKTTRVDGQEVSLRAAPRSIACYDLSGREIEELSLAE